MRFLKILGWAVAWQVVPVIWCAFRHVSQRQGMTLLLLVMPLTAAAHQYVFVQQDRRAWESALGVFAMTLLVGLACIAAVVGLWCLAMLGFRRG